MAEEGVVGSGGLTARIVERLESRPRGSFTEQAARIATISIADTLACMLAGYDDAATRIVEQTIHCDETLPASLIGGRLRAMPVDAALVNGTSGHALDFDDCETATVFAHPSVALVPAIFALAEAREATGAQMIDAYIAGYEAMQALSLLINPGHYARGFHSTGTGGALGAAVACARLLNLDREQIARVIGLAISLMCGVRINFGTHAKPLHAGLAASAGVRAALLVARGFSASPQGVEGEAGLLATFGSADVSPDRVLADWFDGKVSLTSHPPLIKAFPSCGCTHSAIEAVLALRSRLALDETRVGSVEIFGPSSYSRPLIHPRPTSGLEAKFSMEGCVALAIVDGTIGPAQFEDASVRRPSVQRLIERVSTRFEGEEDLSGGLWARVRLVADGVVHEEVVEQPMGAPLRPFSLEDVLRKLDACMAAYPAEVRAALGARLAMLPASTGLSDLLGPLSYAAATDERLAGVR